MTLKFLEKKSVHECNHKFVNFSTILRKYNEFLCLKISKQIFSWNQNLYLDVKFFIDYVFIDKIMEQNAFKMIIFLYIMM